MEQAIACIVGLILVIVLYQERTRRADAAALRRDMNAGFTALRDELKADMTFGFAHVDRRFDNLTAVLVALAESFGQVKGRAEVLTTAE